MSSRMTDGSRSQATEVPRGKFMHGNRRTVNLAIAAVVLASTLIFAGTAAARPGFAGLGHTRSAGPFWMSRSAPAAHSSAVTRGPWYRESGRNTWDAQASRPPTADQHSRSYSPWPAAEPARQGVSHANSPRAGDTPGAESRQAVNDYRQQRREDRHATIPAQQANSASAPAESPQPGRDYRQINAQNRYASNPNVAVVSAPVPVQPVYTVSAPGAGYGYGASAGNNLFPLANLLVDAVSALADYLRADEQYEGNQAYDRGD